MQPNPFLESLNANIGVMVDRLGAGNIFAIYGTGAPETDFAYDVRPAPRNSSMWGFGRVTSICEDSDGDDLIPAESASLIRSGLLSAVLSPYNEAALDASPEGRDGGARHKEIVFHTLTQTQFLPGWLAGYALFPFEEDYRPETALEQIDDLWAIISACPINMMITDPEGRRLGYDPETGEVVREIPNSLYTKPGVEPQIILLGDPMPGSYLVAVSGYEDGDYRLKIHRTGRHGNSGVSFFTGDILKGEITFHDVILDDPTESGSSAGSPPEEPAVEEENPPPPRGRKK